jgi:hypothetical protein
LVSESIGVIGKLGQLVWVGILVEGRMVVERSF